MTAPLFHLMPSRMARAAARRLTRTAAASPAADSADWPPAYDPKPPQPQPRRP